MDTQSSIAKLGSILAIWAHPDDETFCAGGLLAQAVKNGQRVVCITATKGEQGSQDATRWPTITLGDTRAQELEAALKVLGVSEHHWLSYADGECNAASGKQALQAICGLFTGQQFDSVVSFGPDGLTGHLDHQAIAKWAVQVAKQLHIPAVYQVALTPDQYTQYFQRLDTSLDIFFKVDRPLLTAPKDCALILELDDALRAQKYQALEVMPSQTEKMLSSFEKDFLLKAFGTEAFVRAV